MEKGPGHLLKKLIKYIFICVASGHLGLEEEVDDETMSHVVLKQVPLILLKGMLSHFHISRIYTHCVIFPQTVNTLDYSMLIHCDYLRSACIDNIQYMPTHMR